MQTQTLPNTTSIDTDIDTEQAYFAKQAELEQLYDKNKLHARIRREFIEEKAIDFVKIMEDHEIPIPFGLDVLTEICLRKRATVTVMVGLLRRHLKDSQATADMLIRCAEADLLIYSLQERQFIVMYELSQDVQDELDRFQFPLPMVVRPRTLRCNTDTGYLTGSGSVILRGNHTEEDVCLDHLNRMNGIRFSIDENTAAMVKNQWRDLDKQKPGETKADFNRRKRAFDKYDRVAKDVIGTLTELGNAHYMTHRYDKRGRIYCAGYHINYQGTDWNKAVIQLADKEYVQ